MYTLPASGPIHSQVLFQSTLSCYAMYISDSRGGFILLRVTFMLMCFIAFGHLDK